MFAYVNQGPLILMKNFQQLTTDEPWLKLNQGSFSTRGPGPLRKNDSTIQPFNDSTTREFDLI